MFGVDPPPGEEEDSPNFPVFEENWTIAEMFLRLSTQWVFAGMGGARVGLNYQSVDFLFRMYEPKHRATVLEGIQLMEMSALAVWREGAG